MVELSLLELLTLLEEVEFIILVVCVLIVFGLKLFVGKETDCFRASFRTFVL